MLAELRREIAAGHAPIDRQTSIGALLVAWLKSRAGVVSDATWLRYEAQIRLSLAGLARHRASALTAEDVRVHLRTLSPAAGRAVLRILRTVLAIAEEDGIVTRNVAAHVEPPRRDVREGVALTGAQVRRLLDAATDDPLRPLWALLFGSGLRMGEALGLRWSAVDITGRLVRVEGAIRHQDRRCRGTGARLALQPPKTDAGRRTAPLAGFAARALDGLPRDAVYVFHRRNGRPLNPSTVQRAFAAAVERAALQPMRLHDTRHTAATLALTTGASLDDVKRMLGHASIAVTSDTYGHLVADRQVAIADALDAAIG